MEEYSAERIHNLDTISTSWSGYIEEDLQRKRGRLASLGLGMREKDFVSDLLVLLLRSSWPWRVCRSRSIVDIPEEELEELWGFK